MSVFGAAMEAGALFQHIRLLPGTRPAASELATTQTSGTQHNTTSGVAKLWATCA